MGVIVLPVRVLYSLAGQFPPMAKFTMMWNGWSNGANLLVVGAPEVYQLVLGMLNNNAPLTKKDMLLGDHSTAYTFHSAGNAAVALLMNL